MASLRAAMGPGFRTISASHNRPRPGQGVARQQAARQAAARRLRCNTRGWSVIG
ncbi:hypothetical protein [Siccirubricoccus phaeus]|uniref:hypothetical protein n=1 Tax=Siccirubricoccus phaeus TaxID=2595053 RepID=UPI00165ADBAD|nr:hypothetical protein [Siccirubricoccus phaeus]